MECKHLRLDFLRYIVHPRSLVRDVTKCKQCGEILHEYYKQSQDGGKTWILCRKEDVLPDEE